MKKSTEDFLSLLGIMVFPLISLICGIWIISDKSMIPSMAHPLPARIFFSIFTLMWAMVLVILPFWWYRKPRN